MNQRLAFFFRSFRYIDAICKVIIYESSNFLIDFTQKLKNEENRVWL